MSTLRSRAEKRAPTLPMKRLRCAIYTRKSNEQGLDQAFTSLDNQREAAEAYIKSQAHEGWLLLPAPYDDGGISGGTLERPALQRLLAEVRAGRVDVIVVYKVDRLTRSLADFAKLVELFDQHGTSFVSVTQAFNTTSSMGRLTLNVLLSFAQFEREVTGERIRDKIAASKKKGLRVGGPVPLGYKLENKALVPCPEEAEVVRLIFRRYLDLGSLRELLGDLDKRELLTKRYVGANGRVRGGVRFNVRGLSHILHNRAYVGEVVHRTHYYPGVHEPIVPDELFGAVQEKLSTTSPWGRHPNANRDSLLKGILYDARGHRMTPTSSRSRGPLYRYYISRPATEGRKNEVPGRFRVSAPEIEAKVLGAVGLPAAAEPAASDPALSLRTKLLRLVQRVTLHQERIEILMQPDPDGEALPPITVPFPRSRTSAARAIIAPSASVTGTDQPMSGDQRARLVQGMANARLWLTELANGTQPDLKSIAARDGYSERYVRMVLNLAFVPPEVAKAAVEGTLPKGAGVVGLSEAPLWWGGSDMGRGRS